jgi:hypothetical protein
LLLALGVATVLGLAAASASGHGTRPVRAAGDITKSDKAGDVKKAKTAGLTAAQRAALDIASVHVIGDSRLGLLVDVRLRGNYAGLVGKGKLKNAGLALVVRADGRARDVMFNFGPGKVGETLYDTNATAFGVSRSMRDVTFFLRGSGFASVDSISVSSFGSAPFSLPKYAPGGDDLTSGEIRQIIRGANLADLETLTHGDLDSGGLDDLSCLELERLADVLDDEIALVRGFSALFGSNAYVNAYLAGLEHMLDDAEAILDEECGPPVKLAYELWYWHQMPGVSYDCARVIAPPSWAGATGMMSISGPGVVGTSSKPVTLGMDGSATASFQINAFGDYRFDTTLTRLGKTVSESATITVGSAQGMKTCP